MPTPRKPKGLHTRTASQGVYEAYYGSHYSMSGYRAHPIGIIRYNAGAKFWPRLRWTIDGEEPKVTPGGRQNFERRLGGYTSPKMALITLGRRYIDSLAAEAIKTGSYDSDGPLGDKLRNQSVTFETQFTRGTAVAVTLKVTAKFSDSASLHGMKVQAINDIGRTVDLSENLTDHETERLVDMAQSKIWAR